MAYLDTPRPIAMAHRGGAAYAPNIGIENTARAFATAVDLGFGYLETDVRASADGQAVVVHDARLDRLCGVPVRVADATWAQLRALRVGGREPLPRLDAVLTAFPGVRFNIDVKADDAVQPTVAAVRAAGAEDRVLLASFFDRRIRRIRSLAGPRVATSCSSVEVALLRLGRPAPVAATAARRGAVCAQVPWRTRGVTVVTDAFVRRAHGQGMQVHVWAVEDEPGMHALLDLGVDGLITDHIDLLLRTLRVRQDRAS